MNNLIKAVPLILAIAFFGFSPAMVSGQTPTTFYDADLSVATATSSSTPGGAWTSSYAGTGTFAVTNPNAQRFVGTNMGGVAGTWQTVNVSTFGYAAVSVAVSTTINGGLIPGLDQFQISIYEDGGLSFTQSITIGATYNFGIGINTNNVQVVIVIKNRIVAQRYLINSVKITGVPGPALPISLKSFDMRLKDEKLGKAEGKVVIASQSNAKTLFLERYKGGNSWETIDAVDLAGTTQEEKSYVLSDGKMEVGPNSYRLRQVDYDGSTNYPGDMKSLIWQGIGNVKAYPNPTTGLLTVDLGRVMRSGDSEIVGFYTQSGQQVKEVTLSERISPIDLSDLSKGIYYLRVGNSFQKIGVQ